jgi:hypothetical protein
VLARIAAEEDVAPGDSPCMSYVVGLQGRPAGRSHPGMAGIRVDGLGRADQHADGLASNPGSGTSPQSPAARASSGWSCRPHSPARCSPRASARRPRPSPPSESSDPSRSTRTGRPARRRQRWRQACGRSSPIRTWSSNSTHGGQRPSDRPLKTRNGTNPSPATGTPSPHSPVTK